MFVVIFRARVRRFDEEYSRVAARMRDLAMREFGCLEFHAVTEGEHEVALSYWPDEQSIRAWRNHPEHVLAQQAGRAIHIHVRRVGYVGRAGQTDAGKAAAGGGAGGPRWRQGKP